MQPVMQRKFKYTRVSLFPQGKRGRLKLYEALHYQPSCTHTGACADVNTVVRRLLLDSPRSTSVKVVCRAGFLTDVSMEAYRQGTSAHQSTPMNCLFASEVPNACTIAQLPEIPRGIQQPLAADCLSKESAGHL